MWDETQGLKRKHRSDKEPQCSDCGTVIASGGDGSQNLVWQQDGSWSFDLVDS
jgi:hypothetical protein